jgi:UBX domain-containing protein 1/4
MAATDLEQLIEMGFDKERAELAVKNTGGCQWFPKGQSRNTLD